jgi:hypothetical protein
MFTHIVLFWLKEDAPASAREALRADCLEFLKPIPTVRHLFAAPPAMTPREVVDNSYDVGLCVIMDDKAGHDVYQEHPLHKKFIERNKQHWKRVQIYDFA